MTLLVLGVIDAGGDLFECETMARRGGCGVARAMPGFLPFKRPAFCLAYCSKVVTWCLQRARNLKRGSALSAATHCFFRFYC